MILAVDVDYNNENALIAGITFSHWRDEKETAVYKSQITNIEAYEPGNFYRRELPCILELIKEHTLKPEIVVIDGFVWLDGTSRPGLGAHLYSALGNMTPVIGVAKKSFAGIPPEYALLRGKSNKPLYITCSGIELESALLNIKTMAGKYRLPTLLKKVDRLCREG